MGKFKQKFINAATNAGKAAGEQLANVAKASMDAVCDAATTGAAAAGDVATAATDRVKAVAKKTDTQKFQRVFKRVLVAQAGSAAAVAFVSTGGVAVVVVGVVGGVAAKHLYDKIGEDALQHEALLDSIRQSYNSLADATPAQIAEHFQQYTAEQMQGVVQLVKGKFHENMFAHKENTDGDGWTAKTHESPNHPGSDIELTNTSTGAMEAVQLKATDSLAYIQEHLEKYPDIPLLVTEEIAQRFTSLKSSGFSNEELTDFVTKAIHNLIA